LLTDENVSDAMNHLNIEIDMDNQTSRTTSPDTVDNLVFNITSDEETLEEQQSGIVISDVLKTRLKELNDEDLFLSKLKPDKSIYTDLDKLQIIPWVPSCKYVPTQEYQVEEPNQIRKNKLKRKLSQLNRIHIEEVVSSNDKVSNMGPAASHPSYQTFSNALPNFYLVEHEDDFKKYDADMSKNSSSYNITEINDSPQGDMASTGDEDVEMEF
jgi:hypothetical protein